MSGTRWLVGLHDRALVYGAQEAMSDKTEKSRALKYPLKASFKPLTRLAANQIRQPNLLHNTLLFWGLRVTITHTLLDTATAASPHSVPRCPCLNHVLEPTKASGLTLLG